VQVFSLLLRACGFQLNNGGNKSGCLQGDSDRLAFSAGQLDAEVGVVSVVAMLESPYFALAGIRHRQEGVHAMNGTLQLCPVGGPFGRSASHGVEVQQSQFLTPENRI
jgi:hypothetical protein